MTGHQYIANSSVSSEQTLSTPAKDILRQRGKFKRRQRRDFSRLITTQLPAAKRRQLPCRHHVSDNSTAR